jgi:hypothetical protein
MSLVQTTRPPPPKDQKRPRERAPQFENLRISAIYVIYNLMLKLHQLIQNITEIISLKFQHPQWSIKIDWMTQILNWFAIISTAKEAIRLKNTTKPTNLEELTNNQLLKKSSVFYGRRRFITAFTSLLPVFLLIQMNPMHNLNPIYLRHALTLSSHLRLGLPSGIFLSGYHRPLGGQVRIPSYLRLRCSLLTSLQIRAARFSLSWAPPIIL